MDSMSTRKNKLIGKTVMSKEGLIIGTIKDIQKHKGGKGIQTTLITPSKDSDVHVFKRNKNGEIEIPYTSLTKVKDIFVCESLAELANTLKPLS